MHAVPRCDLPHGESLVFPGIDERRGLEIQGGLKLAGLDEGLSGYEEPDVVPGEVHALDDRHEHGDDDGEDMVLYLADPPGAGVGFHWSFHGQSVI